MTLEERKNLANAEYREIIQWAIRETEKVWEQLGEKGVLAGLDTNREVYATIHEEYKLRFLALFDKYDLPNKPKL